LLSAMLKSAEVGLEPDGTLAALVPFRNNKTGKMEATYQTMWQGLAELVREANDVIILDTDVVHEYDKFIFIKGIDPRLEHTPPLQGERGAVIGAWALIKYANGGVDIEYMSKEDIDKIRATSKAKEYGPWATFWNEMARKTVFKRLTKRVKKSSRLLVAMDTENRFEEGETVDIVALPEMPAEALPEPEPTATERLAAKTKKKRGRPAKSSPEPENVSPEPEISSQEKMATHQQVDQIHEYLAKLKKRPTDIGINQDLDTLTWLQADRAIEWLKDKLVEYTI